MLSLHVYSIIDPPQMSFSLYPGSRWYHLSTATLLLPALCALRFSTHLSPAATDNREKKERESRPGRFAGIMLNLHPRLDTYLNLFGGTSRASKHARTPIKHSYSLSLSLSFHVIYRVLSEPCAHLACLLHHTHSLSRSHKRNPRPRPRAHQVIYMLRTPRPCDHRK